MPTPLASATIVNSCVWFGTLSTCAVVGRAFTLSKASWQAGVQLQVTPFLNKRVKQAVVLANSGLNFLKGSQAHKAAQICYVPGCWPILHQLYLAGVRADALCRDHMA